MSLEELPLLKLRFSGKHLPFTGLPLLPQFLHHTSFTPFLLVMCYGHEGFG
ncbi:unnamed protein product, partial [Allacma fusca]